MKSKLKKFFKTNTKRFICVAFCFLMVMSFSITSFAWDNGAPSLNFDTSIYCSKGYCFYNALDDMDPTTDPLPQEYLFSPFSFVALSNALNVNLVLSSGDSYAHIYEDEFFAVTYLANMRDSTKTSYITYFVMPYAIYPENVSFLNSFWGFLSAYGPSSMGPNDNFGRLYAEMLISSNTSVRHPSSSSPYLVVNQFLMDYTFSNCLALSTWLTDVNNNYVGGIVYSVEWNPNDGLIQCASQVANCERFVQCFNYLPHNSNDNYICQIYCGSGETTGVASSVANHAILGFEDVDLRNLNYNLSLSTFAVNCYDTFDIDVLENFSSAGFQTWSPAFQTSTSYGIPSVITASGVDESYYAGNFTYQLFNENKTYIAYPFISDGKVNGYYYFVFPDGSSPILYFKWMMTYGGSYSPYYRVCRVFCNTSYELYGNVGRYGALAKIGDWDASTTTFTCLNTCSYNDARPCPIAEVPSNVTNPTPMTANTTYHYYPYILACYGPYSRNTPTQFFPLKGIFGNNSCISVFPSDEHYVGFYNWIAPDVKEQTIEHGYQGHDAPPSGGSGNSSGESWTHDFGGIDADWGDISLDGIEYARLPEYPDLSDFRHFDPTESTLSSLDEYLAYFVACLEWYGDAFEIYVTEVSTPVTKVARVGRMVFDALPVWITMPVIIFILSLTIMKLMSMNPVMLFSGSMSSRSVSPQNAKTKEKKSTEEEKKEESDKKE